MEVERPARDHREMQPRPCCLALGSVMSHGWVRLGDGRRSLFQGHKAGAAILPRANSEPTLGYLGVREESRLPKLTSAVSIMLGPPPPHHREDAAEWVRSRHHHSC